jgi:hypothetical protein
LNLNANILIFVGIILILLDISPGQADGLTWTAHDPQYVLAGNNSVHFTSRDPKLGKDWTTAPLRLSNDQPWEIDFTVQMLPATGAAMCVKLIHGQNTVCWMGADDYYKVISGFLTGDATSIPYYAPWDNRCHAFKYISDGKRLSLWHNGQKMGDTALTDTPDAIYLESTGIDLTVTDIRVTSGVADTPINITISKPQGITLHLAPAPPAPQTVTVPYYVPVYVPYEPLYEPLEYSWTYTETDTYYSY